MEHADGGYLQALLLTLKRYSWKILHYGRRCLHGFVWEYQTITRNRHLRVGAGHRYQRDA